MFSYIIFVTPNGVLEIVFLYNIDLFFNMIVWQMLCLIVSLADVFAWQMLFAFWNVADVITKRKMLLVPLVTLPLPF